MSVGEEPRRTDAWVLPPGIPAPGACEDLRAGDLPVRHPARDAVDADGLISALRAARRDLAAIATEEMVRILGDATDTLVRELDRADLLDIAANGRLSEPMARAVVDGMAPSWTSAAIGRLVRAEFPDPRVLDGFVAEAGRRVRAAGPAVTLHFGAGSVPGVTVTSMIRALLVRSAVLVKPGAGDIALTLRFARLLRRADPRLARAVAVQYWPGGAPEWDRWERDLLRAADQVVVYGGDAAIESVRARAPAATRLIEHPHRVGVAIVGDSIVGDATAAATVRIAAATARAATLFEQRGCVSTHLVLVLAGEPAVREFCAALATSLAALERELPPGRRTPAELSELHQRRGRLAMKGAALWPDAPGGWSVVLAPAGAFEPVGSRTVWVLPVDGFPACLKELAPLSPVMQTVGLAGIEPDRAEALAEDLLAIGATRIVGLDQTPFPEPDWLHDGSRPLRELVRWGELRQSPVDQDPPRSRRRGSSADCASRPIRVRSAT